MNEQQQDLGIKDVPRGDAEGAFVMTNTILKAVGEKRRNVRRKTKSPPNLRTSDAL